MTILNRLYALSDEEMTIETPQIDTDSEVHYLCRGFNDIIATTENGDVVTFLAAAIGTALPARNSDGIQDLQFVINNIDSITSTMIRSALDDLSEVSLTYHNYVSTDLSAPASVLYALAIRSSPRTSAQAQITAGYTNVFGTTWSRYRYTLPHYSGLRYMS